MPETNSYRKELTPLSDPAPDLLHLLAIAEAKLKALNADPVEIVTDQKQELLSQAQEAVRSAKQLAGQIQRETGHLNHPDQLPGERAFFRAVLEQMPSGVIIAEAPTGRIIQANQQVAEIWRHSFIPSKSISDYEAYKGFHPDGRPYQPEEWPLARSLQLGEVVSGEEIRYLRGDGTYGTMIVSSSPVFDQGGVMIAAVVVFSDVTDRQQSAEALLESERRFRALADGTPVMIWVTDASGEIEFVNRAYTEFFGVTQTEVQLGGWQPLVHPEDTSRYVDMFMDCLQEKRPFRAQARVRRLDGQWRWMESQGQPRLSTSGEFLGISGSSLDITELKQAEEALREGEARFRSVLENSQDVVYRRNLRTDCYDYMSPVVEQVLGFNVDEMNAMAIEQVMERIHPEDQEPIEAQLALAVQTGQAKLEYRFKHKDGGYRWLADYVTVVLDRSGQPLYRIGSLRDVSGIKQTEDELRALNLELEGRVAERTEELLEMQRRLIDGVEAERSLLAREIHDGPMQDIYGLSYRLAGFEPDAVPGTFRDEIESINQELLRINQGLRAISQDLLPLTLSKFGLEKAIQAHVERIQPANPELEISLDLSKDGGSLAEPMRLALYRIYQTSITNVIRHAQASKVSIRFYRGEGSCTLEVEDNGVGFEMPDSLINFARDGHLGLASAQERAQSVGGRMELRSRPGEGTLLRVAVPGPP